MGYVEKPYLDSVGGKLPTNFFGHIVKLDTPMKQKKEVKSLFGGTAPFDTPKPTRLLERILDDCNREMTLYVLDFFSGSATTAHAVMKNEYGR